MKIKHYIYIRCKVHNKNRILMKFYKNRINVYDVIERNDFLYLKVNIEDYERIKKTIVTAKFYYIDDAGIFHLKRVITPLILFSAFLFLFCANFFSQVIVCVDVIHSNKEIREMVARAIDSEGIRVWSIKKDYNELQRIKERVLSNYKDKLEWLEIENVGMKYVVRIEERIMNQIKEDKRFCHVVASKSGIVSSVKSTKGEVLVHEGQYVKEGDILVSGEIKFNEEVKNNVCASGEVLAEVWYQTGVSLPINYVEKNRTGKKRYNLSIGDDSGNYKIFKSRLKSYETEETVLFHLFNFTFYKLTEYEVEEINKTHTLESGEYEGVRLADEKIKMQLKDNESIYTRKVLKKSINDSTIDIEIFYSVLEDIAKTEEYFIDTEEEGS